MFLFYLFESFLWVLAWNCILKAASGTVHSSTADINSDCLTSPFLFPLTSFLLAFISVDEACEPGKYKIDLWGLLIRHILLKRGCRLLWCQVKQTSEQSSQQWWEMWTGFALCCPCCHVHRWLTYITHTRLDTPRRLHGRYNSNI